jgi:hypothetical protein
MKKQIPSIRQKKVTSKSQTAAREGSVYDKVIKENFEKSLKTINQDIGGLSIIKFQPLRTKMQHTKERDPDELSKIWLADGSQKILHAEVHLKDEEDIVFRLCEYYVMVKRKNKKLPIIQYIIYIGNEMPKHITGLWESDELVFRFKVIILHDVPYEVFLNAKNPETVVFSILANFEKENPESVGIKIAERIKKLAPLDSEREKYFTQLRVLSNIRKLQPTIDKIMDNIFKLIDISGDPLYSKGKDEGKLEGKLEGVESLLTNTNFEDEYIAFLMAVPIEFVKNSREKLNKNKVKN